MLHTVAEIYRKNATPIVVGNDSGAGVIPGGAQRQQSSGAPAPAAGVDAQRAAVLDS